MDLPRGAARVLERFLPDTPQGSFRLGWLVATALGLAIILFIPALTGLSASFGGSGHDGYWELANQVIRGHGYVVEPGGPAVVHRPPLVPILFSPLTLLPLAMQRPGLVVLQGLLVGAGCFLLFDLATRIAGRQAARFSVAITLGYPWLYWHAKNPMNVVTQMVCALAIIDLLAREMTEENERSRWYLRAAFLGTAGAAAMATHGSTLLSLFLLLAGVAGIGVVRGRRRWIAVPVVAGCLAALMIAPWTYRNWTVAHRFVPVVSNAGLAYFWGNAHWELNGATNEEELARALQLAGIRGSHTKLTHYCALKDPATDALVDRRMTEHVREDPAWLVKKVALNATEFFVPSVYDLLKWRRCPRLAKMAIMERAGLSVWHLGLWGLALLGLWRNRRPLTRVVPLLAIVACIVALALPYLPFLVSIGHSQYVLSTIPLLALLAGSGLASRTGEDSRRHRERAGEETRRSGWQPTPKGFGRPQSAGLLGARSR